MATIPEMAAFLSFSIEVTGTSDTSVQVTVVSEDIGGATIDELPITLTQDDPNGPYTSEPILWQVTPQSITDCLTITGVVGGSVYAKFD